jgi:hypothetical protein
VLSLRTVRCSPALNSEVVLLGALVKAAPVAGVGGCQRSTNAKVDSHRPSARGREWMRRRRRDMRQIGKTRESIGRGVTQRV